MLVRPLMSRVRAFVAAVAAVALLPALAGSIGLMVAPWGAAPAWAERTCRVGPERSIYMGHRPYLSCAQAKRVLFRLKDGHETVPMACHRPLTVMGWRITVASKNPSGMISTYKRGRYSFEYMRPATPRHSCPPSEGDEPDAESGQTEA
jgi:hypothetical protein